jgi:hypothetical protein
MQSMPNRIMLAAFVAYTVLRTLSLVFADVANSPLRAVGADFLAPLVLIPLFTWLQVLWGLRSPYRRIGAMEIVVYVAAFSLIYELVLPALLPRLVGDLFDVAAYGAGGTVLWLALQMELA